MDSFGNVHSIAKSKFNGIGDELTNPESFTNADWNRQWVTSAKHVTKSDVFGCLDSITKSKYFAGTKWIS